MRRIALIALAAACLHAGRAEAQQVYAGVLLEYLTGDADAAVAKARSLDRAEILAVVTAFTPPGSRLVLTAAAALPPEAAFRPGFDGVLGTFPLQVATAIVQFGERAGVKTNTPLSIRPVFAAP